MDNVTTTAKRSSRTPEVMVSYSSQDRARVMQFVRGLRGSGVAVWIDQGGIDGAQRWSEEIVNAIEASSTVLLFISRASMESQNIAKEVALAWESGKHFLPVALEEAKIPKSMQYQLAGIQYVKLYEGNPDAKFESVLRALVRLGVRVSPYSMAVVSAGIGEREQALEWLAKACEERSNGLSRLKGEPRFHPLRADSRFIELAKHAESLVLEPEEVTAEIVLPQLLSPESKNTTPPTPAPFWKRLLWPEITDDKSARQAAGLGVWTSGTLIAVAWLVSFLVPVPTMTIKSWWMDPIVLSGIYAAIGFGVQKMGRPAAVTGAILCAMGVMGYMAFLPSLRTAMDMQHVYTSMGQSAPGQPDYATLYYTAVFAVFAGVVYTLGFVNAWRGTFAYHAMVLAGRATDKQDALGPQDLLAVQRKTLALVQRVWGRGTLAAADAKAVSDLAPAQHEVVAAKTPMASVAVADEPLVRPAVASAPVTISPTLAASRPAVVPVTPPAPIDHFPEFDDAPEVNTLGDLVGSHPFRVTRALAFLAANVAAGMAFMLARALILTGPLHPVYWQLTLLHGLALTLATLVAFRLVRSGWIASAVAALGTSILMMPVYNTLGTFNFADLFYREQFQEFVVVPLVFVLSTLLGLFFLVPRVRPLALGLWVGAVCGELVASMVITASRDLGAGQPPDPVLAGTLIFFVGVRSLVFAAVFWAGLRLSGVGRRAA